MIRGNRQRHNYDSDRHSHIPAATMEHGAGERVEEESHTQLTIKTDVEKAVQSTVYDDMKVSPEINVNFVKEEPALEDIVKREPALMVKEEAVVDGWRDNAEQQRVQSASTSADIGSAKVFAKIADLDSVINIKEEHGAIDIGPTVLQKMDTQYTTNQKDMSVVKPEVTINHGIIDPILCAGVKEEIIEDEWRGSRTHQDSMMEQPGTCTVLHSLRKECLETVCTVQLRRLDIIQCDICDAVYVDAHKLLQHVQEVHGPGPKRSLDRHVKSPVISNKPQQCATVSSPVVYTCDYCHKIYATKQGLVNHIDVHTKVRYWCSECNKELTGKLSLQAHIRRVHSKAKNEVTSPVVHACESCHKTYKTKQGLICHIDVVHTKVLYRCSECNKEYKGKHLLQGHIKKEHSKGEHEVSSPVVYTCDYCHKIYTTKQGLVNHIGVHTKVRYRCSECNKEYTRKLSLQAHIRRVHFKEKNEVSSPVVYTCDYCHKIYTTKQGLVNHIGVHTKVRYRCSECNKEYTRKLSLQAHIRRLHFKEKNEVTSPVVHTCEYCHETYTSKPGLSYHKKIAHIKALYRCSECNKEYKGKRLLQGHINKEHSKEEHEADTDPQRSNEASQSKQRAPSQLYSCDKCVKTYAYKESLMAHYRNRHSTESHKCTRCDKIFASKAYLYNHTSYAHGEQECECAVCKKIYGSKAALYFHVYGAHRPRPALPGLPTQYYMCKYCQKTFRYKSSLQRHTENYHVAAHIHRCRRCNMNFECNDELQRHNTSIHAYYKCELCLRLYMSKATLSNHFKKAHNSKDIQFQSDVHPHEMLDSRPTADVTNAAASTSKQQHNVDVVKEEPADAELELGPIVFQHMDCNYRPYEGEPQDGSGD